MRLTVGIPTWNRASLLGRTLSRLESLRVPAGVEWELLVVDNNSRDDTGAVLESFRDRLPLIPLFESRQGRSWALNRALETATGEFVLWIDDDILVDREWLAEYHAAFLHHPDAGVFGGRIVPRFEGDPPAWLLAGLEEVAAVYGACEPTNGPIRLTDPFLPFGGNMAVRTELQRRFPFDVRLGRSGGVMLAGEESLVVRAALEAGIAGWWLPAAVVEHVIPPSMQTVSHIRRYYHDFGATTPLTGGARDEAMILGRPRWAWRQALQGEINFRLARWFRRPARVWVRGLRDASFGWGVLRAKPMKAPT
jgi:glucosyl-dolichyl phosphate glucuronosyltransferase